MKKFENEKANPQSSTSVPSAAHALAGAVVHHLRDVSSMRWNIEVKQEGGKPWAFAITAGGVALALAIWGFLGRAGGNLHWGVLACACAFALGTRFMHPQKHKAHSEGPSENPASSESRNDSSREMKDLGPQTRLPSVQTSRTQRSVRKAS